MQSLRRSSTSVALITIQKMTTFTLFFFQTTLNQYQGPLKSRCPGPPTFPRGLGPAYDTRFDVLQPTVAFGWFLSLFSLAYLVYGLHVVHLDVAGSALYASVGHSAWGAALAWIVIACCTGHGGCVNSALSCRLLQPLSRLTYCAYLVHPIIMATTNFQMDGPLHLHNLITVSRTSAEPARRVGPHVKRRVFWGGGRRDETRRRGRTDGMPKKEVKIPECGNGYPKK